MVTEVSTLLATTQVSTTIENHRFSDLAIIYLYDKAVS